MLGGWHLSQGKYSMFKDAPDMLLAPVSELAAGIAIPNGTPPEPGAAVRFQRQESTTGERWLLCHVSIRGILGKVSCEPWTSCIFNKKFLWDRHNCYS